MKKFKRIRLLSILLAALLIFGNISYGLTAMAAASSESYASEEEVKSSEDKGSAADDKTDVDTESTEDKGSDDTESDTGESDADTESGDTGGSDEDAETGKDEGSDNDTEAGEDEGSGNDTEAGEGEGSGNDTESGEDEESDNDAEAGEDEASDYDTEAGKDEASDEDDEGNTVKDGSDSDEEDEDISDEEEEEEYIDGLIDLEEASPSNAISLLSSVNQLLDLADEDGVIRLEDDMVLTDLWEIGSDNEAEEYTLDLNGHDLTDDGNKERFNLSYITDDLGYSLISVYNGSLTVTDSEGGGSITTGLAHDITVRRNTDNDNELYLYGVTIENSCASGRAVWGQKTILEIDDSTITATGSGSYAVCFLVGSTINISDSILEAKGGGANEALRVGNSQAEISDSEIYSDRYGIYFNNGAEIRVNGCIVQGGEDSNGVAFAIYGDDSHNTTKLTINDGEFSGYQGIRSDPSSSNIVIDIEGGNFSTTHTAIYLTDEGTLNFNDGVIDAGSNGITVRNGEVYISGGEIKATGEKSGESETENGLTGMAVLIGQYTGDKEINVEISGGELYGKTYALYEQDYANDHIFEDKIHVSVSGGIFTNDNSEDIHPVDIKDEDDGYAGADHMISITGGFFSDHVEESDYIDAGYMCIDGISVTGDSGNSYTGYHTVIPDTFSDADLSFSYYPKTFTYNGKAQVPEVSDVKLGDVELIEDKHYTVTYELNGTEIAKEDVTEAGIYTVVVNGTGSEAMCAFDAAGGEHTKKDGLTGSVSGEFTIEESTDNPDDGNPDDGNPDDGNPDDGNPDDGNPDNNNPGTTSHSGRSHSGSGGGSSGAAGSATQGGSYTIYTDENGKSGHWVIEDIGYVNSEGLWVNDWWFSYSDGTYPYNEWVYLSYNGSGAWYFFDENGWMVDGWLNRNGNTYYLHVIPDGTRGYMYTGWNQIDGIWYYFSEDAGTLGALVY